MERKLHSKRDPQRKKTLYEKKAPPQEGEMGPTNRLFPRRIRGGGGQATTLVTPLCAPMSKCDNEMHNIFDNYSPLIAGYNTIPPIISKITPHCLNIDFYHW